MRNYLRFIVAGAMLLALAPATVFALDEPPEPPESIDTVELPVDETQPLPALPVEAVPPTAVAESPGVVAYPLPSENLDVPPEPDPGEAWRTRRSGSNTDDTFAEESFLPEENDPAFMPECDRAICGLLPGDPCKKPNPLLPPRSPVAEGKHVFTDSIKRSPLELGMHGTFIQEDFPEVEVTPAPPRFAPVSPYATAFGAGPMHEAALVPTGMPAVDETPETSSYIALKQQYEAFWKEKIESALGFIPGVRVSVNVEASAHVGTITRVVRVQHGRGHEAGAERSEHVHREIDRPLVTGVCILLPAGHPGPSYHGAAYSRGETLHGGITLAMHGGHETLLGYESQVREIVATILPPTGSAKVVVSHYHPAAAAPATAAPLATAGTPPTVNAGFYLLAGIALCALTTIAVAGGIRISQMQPSPVVDAAEEAETQELRRAA